MYSFSVHIKSDTTGWTLCGKTGSAVVFTDGVEPVTCKSCQKFSEGFSKEVIYRRDIKPHGERTNPGKKS